MSKCLTLSPEVLDVLLLSLDELLGFVEQSLIPCKVAFDVSTSSVDIGQLLLLRIQLHLQSALVLVWHALLHLITLSRQRDDLPFSLYKLYFQVLD
mgnify:CR=1 FL=1